MATLNKYTALEILQIISDLRGESSVNSDAVRIRAIDRAAGDFSTRKFWKSFRLKDQTTTSTGVGDYEIGSSTYPMRAKGLSEVFVGGTLESNRYEIINQNDFKFSYNTNNSRRLAYEWYDAANDKWMMHISPDTSGETITYTFYWQQPAITTTTSAVYCPDPDIIARRALAYLYEGEDEDKFQVQFQLSEQMADDWDKIEDTPNVNQHFSMTASTSKGIGNF